MTLYHDIKKNFILPTAYEDWTGYRNALTSYLIQETNQVSLPLSFCANMEEEALLPTLAIIGAGACNDIDLSALLPHFSKITLFDYDESAMNMALETYELEECPYIECIVASLNGLNDSHYEEFCNKLQRYVQLHPGNFTPEEFENYAITLVNQYLNGIADYIIPLPKNAYDYIGCFGVHSQLQAMFSYIYHVFEMNLKNMFFKDTKNWNECFTRRLQRENEQFIPRLHDVFFSCAKQAVFLGLERNRTHNHDAVEGAYQAFQDIKKRQLSIQETTMLWPFLPKEDIEYQMSILKITNGTPVKHPVHL